MWCGWTIFGVYHGTERVGCGVKSVRGSMVVPSPIISIANINADADGTFTHVVVAEEDDY